MRPRKESTAVVDLTAAVKTRRDGIADLARAGGRVVVPAVVLTVRGIGAEDPAVAIRHAAGVLTRAAARQALAGGRIEVSAVVDAGRGVRAAPRDTTAPGGVVAAAVEAAAWIAGSHAAPAQTGLSLMPQLSTQLTGSAQLVAQEVSAFPHWSTQAPECWQDPTTQATQAPLLSHTSPRGQGQVMLPQPSLHLALSGHDGTHVSVFGRGAAPQQRKGAGESHHARQCFCRHPENLRLPPGWPFSRGTQEPRLVGAGREVDGICHRIRLAAGVGVGEAWRNMLPGRHAWLAVLSLWLLACTNTPNTPADASGPVDRPRPSIVPPSRMVRAGPTLLRTPRGFSAGGPRRSTTAP